MKRVGTEITVPSVAIGEASFPAPFASGLEYSAPARGGWTIVHVGMLLPEAHEIFVCAAGCLRGVVLSAAEMNLTGRFSTVSIEEHNVCDGDMEDLIIDGVSDILHRLPNRPKAVLVYSSCIHHFMGCDLQMCYRVLRERFPEVDFADCYMIPTMRKSGLTPDQIMRRQLYSLIKPQEKQEKHCAILGNCFSMEETSDIVTMIQNGGWTLHQITECRTYEEYQEIGKCTLCISTQPVAKAGAEVLAERLEMKHLYLPAGFDREKIRRNLTTLADCLGISYERDTVLEKQAETALRYAAKIIGDTPVAIDHTFAPRLLELTSLLLESGFRVTALFTDSFNGEEKEEFLRLQKSCPELKIVPTVRADMRRFQNKTDSAVLALGQKAAFFTKTPYFVDLVEGGGLYGFDGLCRLSELMVQAYIEPKDTEAVIQKKGLGCESCV